MVLAERQVLVVLLGLEELLAPVVQMELVGRPVEVTLIPLLVVVLQVLIVILFVMVQHLVH